MSEGVTVVSIDDVPPIELGGGSWSRVLVNAERVGGNHSSIGYSVFTPGSHTADLSHETEELAYVVRGSGELRLRDGIVRFGAGDGLYVSAKTWHVVANVGDEDLVMVFTFPHPDYPPTERA